MGPAARLQRPITACTDAGIELDRTVFCPLDRWPGRRQRRALVLDDGSPLTIADTRRARMPTASPGIVHIPAAETRRCWRAWHRARA